MRCRAGLGIDDTQEPLGSVLLNQVVKELQYEARERAKCPFYNDVSVLFRINIITDCMNRDIREL